MIPNRLNDQLPIFLDWANYSAANTDYDYMLIIEDSVGGINFVGAADEQDRSLVPANCSVVVVWDLKSTKMFNYVKDKIDMNSPRSIASVVTDLLHNNPSIKDKLRQIEGAGAAIKGTTTDRFTELVDMVDEALSSAHNSSTKEPGELALVPVFVIETEHESHLAISQSDAVAFGRSIGRDETTPHKITNRIALFDGKEYHLIDNRYNKFTVDTVSGLSQFAKASLAREKALSKLTPDDRAALGV